MQAPAKKKHHVERRNPIPPWCASRCALVGRLFFFGDRLYEGGGGIRRRLSDLCRYPLQIFSENRV
jgi:hypothetical protein